MSTKQSVLTNFLWRFLERCGAQGVTFVVSIVLARLLDPEDYAAVAIITVFTTILSVFIDCGFTGALIQKKDAGDLEFSSVFYFNLVSCALIYGVLFFAAPYIAVFYDMPELTAMIRVSSISVLISGVRSIQGAYVSRHMLFKRFFFSTAGGTIVAAIVGIGMAYLGCGTWALIAQTLINSLIDTVILWITVKWRPKKMFSIRELRCLLSYGWKLLVSQLISTIYNNLRSLIIGKLYTKADLSFYNKGHSFPTLLTSNINTAIDSVLLPTMSSQQEDRNVVKAMMRRAMKISTYIMAPMMIGLACCAEPVIELLLTEKWLPCVPFLRAFCIIYMFHPIQTANLNAIKAVGRSDIYLKLEVAKKIVGLVLLVSTMWFGVEVMAYSQIVGTILSMMINAYPNKKLLGYSYFEQMKDVMPGIALSCLMGACVWLLHFLPIHIFLVLVLQVVFGACFYIAGSRILKLESFTYVLETIKAVFKKHV